MLFDVAHVIIDDKMMVHLHFNHVQSRQSKQVL